MRTNNHCRTVGLILATLIPLATTAPADEPTAPTIVAEAEEFAPAGAGWQKGTWGQNYFAATFANSFLSRKAFLSASQQCAVAVATREVNVPQAAEYLVLARYESAYRFETQFRIVVEQNGQVKLDRLFGARKNPKIWAFRQGLQTEVAWSWGAVENIVWEGHDARVSLQAGPATIKLIAGPQPEPAARRNVDLVMLTSDLEQVRTRIEKENYLPLDGMLTQQGDLFLRLHNRGPEPIKLTVPNGTEHSPYWVHIRDWKPRLIEAAAGAASDWVEAGSLLDTLSDGQWELTASGSDTRRYAVEVGVPNGASIRSLRTFEATGPKLRLAYDADTRYSERIRLQREVLRDLVDYVKQQPVRGRSPRLTPIYGYTFDARPEDREWEAARSEFLRLFPLASSGLEQPGTAEQPRGYMDVRSYDEERLRIYLEELKSQGVADKIGVVSLGDEIGLPRPAAADHDGFRQWLMRHGVKPNELVPAAGGDWTGIEYSADPKLAASNPRLYYFARRYEHDFGIQAIKQRTDLLRRYLPNAGIGANFSPHHGHMYLGEVHKWIDIFRQDGMTMPWSEDYIWQVPLGTQQMNFINLDLFRAGIVNKPAAKIHYYVMTHTPGQTTDNWRRQFYGDLAHGMQIVNLFEFRPVQAAYTENHTSDPAMYVAVRRALYELGLFEDIVQAGRVRPGIAAMLFGETGDIWDDNAGSFGAAKRSLYIAARHCQLPLDIVTEEDTASGRLDHYRLLYLTDRHMSRKSAEAIAAWVARGGRLFATAGAGLFDEFDQPNEPLRTLLGIEPAAIEAPDESRVTMIKQDLPFVQPIDHVLPATSDDRTPIPIFGARTRLTANDSDVLASFTDGSPAAVRRTIGKGEVVYCGFLPGLSYFHPAIPRRPVDRGATAESMAHLLPTGFDQRTKQLVASVAEDIVRPVQCSESLVETTVLESPVGVAVPLVNWTGRAVANLTVDVRIDLPSGKPTLASGHPVRETAVEGGRRFQLDLDVADVLIFRPATP
jgi:hypothetical protein